jgi:hypothetical protein
MGKEEWSKAERVLQEEKRLRGRQYLRGFSGMETRDS